MKKLILILVCGILLTDNLYAQNFTGSQTGSDYDFYIANWDNTISQDAGIRLATYRGGTDYRHWNIVNEYGNHNLQFTYSIKQYGKDIGTHLMTLTNVGNLGIGITSPSQKLHVVGNSLITGTIYTNSHGNSSNWKTAYNWGNHASAGYYKSGNSPTFSTITTSGNLRRTNHHTGHLEGSYNNVGSNDTRSNPIYTIGSSYNPSSTSLGNMYGTGYTHANAAFLNSSDLGINPSGWGMYVASDGNARVFLDATGGNGYFKGSLYAKNLRRTAHHTGHLEGSYNNIGSNGSKSNPIYTIGSNYNPNDANLGNMYGIGFTTGSASFINSTDLGGTAPTGWGMYVASDGNARIFLDAGNGNAYFKGDIRSGWLRNTGNVGMYNETDATHFYSEDVNYWKMRSDRGMVIANKANTAKGYIYHDNSNSFGLLDGDQNWGVRLERDSNTSFWINNSEKMRILSSGNVGIGITTPFAGTNNTGLHVDRGGHTSLLIGDGINDGGIIQSSDNTQRVFIGSNIYDDPSLSWKNFKSGSSAAVDVIGNSGLIRFLTSSSANGYASSNVRMSILDDGKVGIGTTSPDHKLSVMGRINASSDEANESTQSIQMWHTAQEGNIGTSSGELRIRKGEDDYLSFKETATASVINSHASNLVLKTDGGTGIEIDQEGDVLIKNDLKMTGQFKLDTAFVIEDAQAHQILNMQTDGTIGFRDAETLTPWVVREVLDADGLPEHVITCDTTLGTSCSCGPQIIAELGLYDMNGNIKIGEGAYIDNDTVPGNNGAADDWIRINNSVEVSSSDPVRGFVLRDMDAQQDHFLNFHQKNGVSYFSNSNTSSNPEDNHFMKAGLDNSVTFPGTVTMPNFSADTLSSKGDLMMVLDSDESADDGTLRIGTGDPNDGVSWKENFNLTPTGIATFSSDIGDSGNPNRVTIDGSTGNTSLSGTLIAGDTTGAKHITLNGVEGKIQATDALEVGEIGDSNYATIDGTTGGAFLTGTFGVGNSPALPNIFFDGTSGNASMTGLLQLGDIATNHATINGITGHAFLTGDLGIGNESATPRIAFNGANGSAIFEGSIQTAEINSYVSGAEESKAFTLVNTTSNEDVFRIYNNGIVEAKEVLVSLDVWHDEVFESDYELMPVEELEDFVNENHHLPEVPAEKEVIEKGVNIGEMQATLLKKIEQLTLYVIDQNKQLKEQMQLIDQQSTKIRKLEQQLD